MKISAVIITYNEEKNIGEAIRSVAWADEVLVVDSESNDGTRKIAESLGARVIVNKWPGFAAQKQFAIEQTTNDWIFSLDADERVSSGLTKEIESLRTAGPTSDGYSIPRLSFYMGRAIRHSGWYPDRQIRLFDRRKGRWKDVLVHESFGMANGSRVSLLKNHLHHYSVEGPEHHHRMIGERYAPLAARQMWESGLRTSALKAALAGPAAFLRSYFLKLGFLDGFPGYCIARFAAHHAFLKHALLLELQDRGRSDSGNPGGPFNAL